MITDEQKERANYVNLPGFLRSHGFDLKKSGREYIWKEHDSVNIKDNAPGEKGQWYRFSTGQGGDNIGFLQEFMGLSFKDAVEVLNGEHYERSFTPSYHQPKSAGDISLAENDNCKRVFAYLCMTRGLDYEMIADLVRNGKISQEQKTGNVLFKYFDTDGKIIGAEKVGTSTGHKFKGIAQGSDSSHGFEIVRGNGRNAYFFESAIDALSYLQMHENLDNCRLVSMMGVKPNIVIDTMKRHGILPENVYICSDNDIAGNDFAKRLQQQYPTMKRISTPEKYKDWNDMLRGIEREVDKLAERQFYGNRAWNDATDNRDKSLVTVSVHDFEKLRTQLENAGINYYGYDRGDSVVMAVNDSDVDTLRKVANAPTLEPRKSDRPYSPPQKNIIGNAEYRYIPQKEYVTAERDLVLKMAERMEQQGLKFSGRIYPGGKGTLTVSHNDLAAVKAIQQDIVNQRKSIGTAEKGQQIGTYQRNSDTRYFMSKIPAKNWADVEKFLDTNINYHAVARDGKIAFALDKDDAPVFHRALQNAEREVNLVHTMQDMGLSVEQMVALSPTVHRLAADDIQLNIAYFFDNHYDDVQFGEMLSLVNAYLSQSPAERYGEHSKLNDMLEAKSNFDRSIELADFFSQHTFSDEQKAAISAMFVGDVTRGQINAIDESFTVQDIHDYDEVLHTALQESDVADFLTVHKQAVEHREPTEEEILFGQADLADFIAQHTLSSDEWEDMAYPLFENGYTDTHKPSEKASFGYHLHESELYALAAKYHDGEDITRDLAVGLLPHGNDTIEFVFEDGKISDRTYYYAENLRHNLDVKYDENGLKFSFNGMEREISFNEVGQAFLDRTLDEWNDLAYWRVLDSIRDDIPDISEDTVQELVTAFDNAKMHGWEDGSNQAKINHIKNALNEILHNEEQTEKAFACIAKQKYNIKIAENTPEISLFSTRQNDEVRYYKTAETADTLIETAKTSECAFIDLEKMGTRIGEAEFAEIEQSDRVKYSADFDFNANSVTVTEINGIDDADRNSENISVQEISLRQSESTLHFGLLGNGITVYDTSELDDETHDYPTVAHISEEGNIKLYRDDISPEDMERINTQAQGQRDKFMAEWNNLDQTQQYQRLMHHADMDTMLNIQHENIPTAEVIDKYMPYVFFGEGERPEPKAVYQVITNAGLDGGIDDKMQYSSYAEAVEAGHDYMADDYLGFAVFNTDTKKIEHTEGDFPVEKAFNVEILRINGIDIPEDKGSMALHKMGDFYEFYGEDARNAADTLGLHLTRRNDEDMVGFPDHVKDDYLKKLSDAGYTVVVMGDPKRELTTLQDVVDVYFGTDCESAETANGTWKLAIADGEKVGELFHNGTAVCGIYNHGDKMSIEPYQELTAFPKMLADAMLAHNPDKPVEIMEIERVYENPLDKAKALINDFCESEYGSPADFSDLHNVHLAYTTYTDDELPLQVTADLIDHAIIHEFNNVTYQAEMYDDLTQMIENGLTGLDFDELVAISDEDIERYSAKGEPTAEIEQTDDIDKPLFTDSAVIDEIKRNEDSDIPFYEMPDIHGEQLTLFGDPEPLTAAKTTPEKPKSEFAKGPVVDGVQVYEALAAEIDRGTGFVHGKLRVQDFYEEKHPTVQELADFLKKEYGTGGHSGEGKISLVDYDSKGLTFSFENGEKFRHSWYNVATMTESRLKDDTYLSAEQKAERAALKVEQSAEEQTSHTVEIGDKFRNKLTGEVSEVVSLTGALPFYTDDCTIETNKGIYVTTENISYDKLMNSDLYEFIGRAEPEKEQPAPEITPEKTDTPTVKSLAQLKRTLQVGMEFEISAHSRPECVGEHRVITGINSVGFTSRKLDEDGKPSGKDIHMEWDKSKNWSFDGGEFTSTLNNGELLMSFHIVDGSEREQVKEPVSAEISPDDTTITPDAPEKVNAPEPTKADNFTITDSTLGEGGAKAKFRANIDAIRTLKTLEKENRPASADEKETLSKYVGWGAIPQAFDKTADKWSAEYAELKDLLNPQEYAQARASVNDAFYTSPTIIEGIYHALEQFGFDGGRVLEPAMGVGNFFGCMPENMQKNSDLYGVEIDSISGRIAQKLYPDADIAVQGFEKNSFQNGCFDVAVGNVPFGELGFVDDRHGTSKLHDYFFAETMDKLKNGGIMAFVTSAGTLDKRDESVRQMLADKADFIGAIRLPGGKNGAFKENAGTQVTTDIIFLQKHEGKSVAEMSDIPDWVHIGQTADGLPINKYFEQNPDMVLGNVVEGNQLYGSGTMVVAEDGFDLKTALHDAVAKLSAAISHEKGRDVYARTEQGEAVKIPSNLRNFSLFMDNDKVYFKKNNVACDMICDKSSSQFKRYKAFIELRDTTRDLLTAQELDKPDSVIKDLQAKLNTIYDDFYKKYGLIHSQSNKRYFGDDVSYNLVAGLEKDFDKTKLKAKSDIFTKRTIVPPKAVEHVETALEALTLSVAEKARVDFEYMGKLTGMTEEELKHDLTGEIFKVPHTENVYQTASEYLSGDIRAKLRVAEEIAEYDADFNINVSALKKAMPEPLKAGDIDIKLGAAWLDPKYYEQFIYELLQTPAYQRSDSPAARWNKLAVIGVEYSDHTNSFYVSNKSSDKSVLVTQKYGSHKMNAYDIFEHILNLQDPKIYKTIEVPDGLGDTKEKRVVDVDATRIVQRKADDMRKAFKDWIFKDPQRREDIVNRYNELFNSIRPREYDGSHLTFPMMSADIQLHPHQKNAIAHAMFGGNTLFAHCVGAGKTFEMIATAMESKRLGLCTKSLFAVPNHLTEQIGEDFQRLYPSANILVATKKDFKKENRQQLFAKIATGNFDAVIIGHSQLGMIPVSKERQVMTIQSQIDDILHGIEELKKKDGSKFQIKAMERTRKGLQKQLDKLEKSNQDDTLTFEQLGVDKLFVDEAHEFKNMFVATKLQNIAGISQSASQKALDLFLKCHYLDEKTGGRGTVFATGTPLSNSITELHTMMRYLEYDFLKDHGLQHFDNWISVFGEQKTDWELRPAGNGFKERTRIANYSGLPELMSMFQQIADIRTADTLKLDVPDCDYQVVQVNATTFQQELVQELADRADAINAGNVDPSIDNMLKITSDGRKLGLDPRLIDPSFEDDPNTKLNKCVENVARIHAETAEDKLTQIIFCDLGVPHKATGDAETVDENGDDNRSAAERESLEEECDFCVYTDIRDKLIARGIPAEEIAFIHDAKSEKQKAELFDKVRSGEVRILLGSTAKMGTGTNVQKKLIAVHDLDIPWRPADLEQRAGRIIRQGNENKNVQIFRYVTKETFDAYSYQTLENKQKFISQIMTSKAPARRCEDVDQQALTYSEIKALCTGDERIKEKLMLENEVKELRVLAAEHKNTVYEMQDKISAFPEKEQRLQAILDGLYADREALRKLPIAPERKLPVFKITIQGTEYTDRKEAAKAFEDAALSIRIADTPVKIGSFQGFDLSVTVNSSAMGGGMTAKMQGQATHSTKLIESFAHNLNRLESALYNIDGRIESTKENLAKLRLDHDEAQKIVAEPFPQQTELDSKEERLKTLTDELNKAAAEAKRNAPKREKTCYFERAKLKRDAMKLEKKPRKSKDKGKDGHSLE